jgi:hypothetical protein
MRAWLHCRDESPGGVNSGGWLAPKGASERWLSLVSAWPAASESPGVMLRSGTAEKPNAG